MKQRILVLGSEHFVGAAVVTALAASHWAEPVTTPGSGLSASSLTGIDAVFNGTMGASAVIESQARRLFEVLKQANAPIRIVHFSSMTVYGSFSGEARETTPLRKDIGAYGAAHVAAEALADDYPHTVILRPGCEYGPGCPQWSGRIARLLRAHRLGDLGAAGDGICNLLFIDDLVTAVVGALQTAGIDGSRFNLAMRSPPTWNEYFVRFGRALGAVPVSRIGARRLKIEGKLLAPPLKILELIEQRLHSEVSTVPAPITPSLLDLCRHRLTLNVDETERVLGIQWTPLEAGLSRAALAYASE